MTTVGYGDRAPKSMMGRVFAVLWIVCGITINSIYVSELTAEIMTSRNNEPEIHGSQVGALKNRFYDAVMILQHGGNLKETDYNNTVAGMVKLISKLERKEIDGFLVTKPTFYYYSREIARLKYQHLRETIQHVRLSRSVKNFIGERPVAGMVFAFLMVRPLSQYLKV